MELHIVKQNGMLSMVEFDQMLERPGGLFAAGVDVVDLDGFDIDSTRAAPKETGQAEWVGESRKGRKHHARTLTAQVKLIRSVDDGPVV